MGSGYSGGLSKPKYFPTTIIRDKRRYHMDTQYMEKGKATKRAKVLKGEGKLIRVVKVGNTWCVYTRG